MLPLKKEHTNICLGEPNAWNMKNGPCSKLYICYQDGINYSYWQPSLRDRIRILFGRHIRLAIIGVQPAVALDTEKK